MLHRKAKNHPHESTIQKLLIPYDLNATPDVVASRRALLAVLSPRDIDTFNDMMQCQWHLEITETDAMWQKELPDEVPEDYLMDTYYNSLFKVYGNKLETIPQLEIHNTVSATLPVVSATADPATRTKKLITKSPKTFVIVEVILKIELFEPTLKFK